MKIITTYFNHTPTRYRNWVLCNAWIQEQGYQLETIEASQDQFVIPNSHRVTVDRVAWWKEYLINRGRRLFAGEDVCWIDCDTIFYNKNWVPQIEKALQQYKLVQAFSHATMYYTDTVLTKDSALSNWEQGGKSGFFPGGAWAMRKDGPDLFEKFLVGGGDTGFFLGITNQWRQRFISIKRICPDKMVRKAYVDWCWQMQEYLGGRIACVPNQAMFLPHGKRSNRAYHERHTLKDQNEIEEYFRTRDL